MAKINELPIGMIIDLPFAKLKVVEDKEQVISTCFECIFADNCPSYATLWFGKCGALDRKDKKYVHFEIVKEDE